VTTNWLVKPSASLALLSLTKKPPAISNSTTSTDWKNHPHKQVSKKTLLSQGMLVSNLNGRDQRLITTI